MKVQTNLHINGEWIIARDDQRFPVYNPATGKRIAEFAAASVDDCLDAVNSAQMALPNWASRPARERAELLRSVFEAMHKRLDELAILIRAENGKSLQDARAEASYAAEFFRWFAEEAVRIPGDFRRAPAGDKSILVTREPIGVALLITPWNFPAAMATRKIAPALAAGCTAVLKPAAETPLTAALILEILEEAGVPPGVVNLVTPAAAGPAVKAMLEHKAVRKVSFTGSTEVGRIILRESSNRVIAASMELGGNAPFVVLPGADISQAVAGALVAKLRNGGAACTAANRFYVHDSLVEQFTSRLVEEMSQTTIGPDDQSQIGALVSIGERDKVHALVMQAQAEGATVLVGGAVSGPGAFYPPTVLTDVEHHYSITQTEIFGPVVPIISYETVDEMVGMANDTEHGLIAYVFGPLGDALDVAKRMEAGMVAVNRGVVSDPAAPFGGTKQSGLGREGAAEGINAFLEEKYIGVDF